MAVVKVLLHSFTMSDVEDPYLYAGFPIHEWQQTEHGKWVMEHAIGDIVFNCYPDTNTYGYKVVITGELEEKDVTFMKLKWS